MLKRLALTLLLIAPSLAGAESFFLDESLTLDDLKSLDINVELGDGATGACWTNLKEAREYAEEKLRTAGLKVSNVEYMNADKNSYWFVINVYAYRLNKDGSGPCVGNYDIQVYAWQRTNGRLHLAILGEKKSGAFIPSTDTFNRPIILGLEEVFASFPKK